ncbi:glycoside hydrolase family 43 protein [Ophiostoma piceae UAMH 11346]|uniref:Glycoside hydrolase family 43 protein n=1 Tax=Ophiostoma piceae (strain UAMH 11346) TaxID=1262450 RepID=S3CAC9_OPHP1|nr:glycoside hydrolase family 43 protein [Ophiostoma piceae UAMH 11346]
MARFHHFLVAFATLSFFSATGAAHPAARAAASLVGYLTIVFLGADPYIYFYLSQGNNPNAFTALNNGSPIIKPTKGTGGVRDPAIVRGGGSEAGVKWYIVGTDLDISKTTWSASQRTGSRGILVWESTDLLTWTNERLVVVEDSTAGMVWAPEAIWDASKGQYMVFWASKFYNTSDTAHTGTPTSTVIRYAYTSDFKTFSAPSTYIDRTPSDTIDLTILPLSASPGLANADVAPASETFLRFVKDETLKTVYTDYSTTGLFGTFTRPGGSSAYIQSGVEGPAAYWDNEVPGKAHLLLDYYGGSGYQPFETTNYESNSGWTASNKTAFPTNLRHGSVLPVDAGQYAALAAKW